jgi:hypothetical protein
MTAADALAAATIAGVTVTLDADGSLMLKANARPPDSVVSALQQHKADIITLLSRRPAASSPHCTPVTSAFAALESRRPDHIDAGAWRQAVEDGRRFLMQRGAEAERLGWTAADIFGLAPIPRMRNPTGNGYAASTSSASSGCARQASDRDHRRDHRDGEWGHGGVLLADI